MRQTKPICPALPGRTRPGGHGANAPNKPNFPARPGGARPVGRGAWGVVQTKPISGPCRSRGPAPPGATAACTNKANSRRAQQGPRRFPPSPRDPPASPPPIRLRQTKPNLDKMGHLGVLQGGVLCRTKPISGNAQPGARLYKQTQLAGANRAERTRSARRGRAVPLAPPTAPPPHRFCETKPICPLEGVGREPVLRLPKERPTLDQVEGRLHEEPKSVQAPPSVYA